MTTIVAQWHNHANSPNDYLLVRLYEGGGYTGERYLDGVAQGEFDLTLEPMAVAS